MLATAAEFQEEIRPVDSGHLFAPHAPAQPHERHAVWSDEGGITMRRKNLLVAIRQHDPVHVAKNDIAAQTLGDPPPHLFASNIHVDQSDRHAGNFETFDHPFLVRAGRWPSRGLCAASRVAAALRLTSRGVLNASLESL